MNTSSLAGNYPALFRADRWGDIQYQFELRDDPPPAHLISNVNLVPFVGEHCLIIHLRTCEWEIPGGTVEPGENYLDTIRRELLEEAGARLKTFEVFGAWHHHSSAPNPYRPHLPHPESFRVVGFGEVELIGSPQNPAGGEQVASVECVTVEEAGQRFSAIGRPELAELYRLAAAVRKKGTGA